MIILEKYILKSYVMSFIFCIVLLIVIGVIGDVLGFIGEIFENNIPLTSILAFYFYLAPFAFVNMVPFACLLAAVYVFNSLSKYHEITAIVASGLSLWKILKPVLLVTMLLCLFTFIVNDRFVPSTMEKANLIRQEKLEVGGGDDKKRPGMRDIALYGKGGQIIFAKTYNVRDKALSNVIIHAEDDSHQIVQKISARSVKWDGKGSWMARDVIVFNVDAAGNFTSDPAVYKTKEIHIRETPEDFKKAQSDPRFMSYEQLKDYLKLLKTGSKETLRRLRVDLNYKLAFPFTALITVLIGVPFSIETGRANALIGMAKGITAGIIYLPVVAVILAFGKGGYIPPLLSAWLGIILFALMGVYFVKKKS